MLSDQDLAAVQAATESITAAVTITFNAAGNQDVFETNLVNTARQISGVSMNRVLLEEGAGSELFPGLPSLGLSVGDSGNIHYYASPEGRELGPFLDALAWLGKGKEPPRSAAGEALADMPNNVALLVLMAEACPHCPQVVRSAISLAVRNPRIRLAVVDAVQFPDVAERFKVKSTPTTIINDGLTIVGHIGTEALAEKILAAGAGGSLTEVLDTMIKSGRAEDAADLLCRRGDPAAILPIYRAPEFSLRIGALYVMEAALDTNPRILDAVVQDLAGLLLDDDVALRGDTAELLGKIGNPAAIPALRKATEDEDPDVREAAQEALALLEE